MLGSMTPTPSWAMLQGLGIANFAVWGKGGGNQSQNWGPCESSGIVGRINKQNIGPSPVVDSSCGST